MLTVAALEYIRAYLPQCWEWTHENIVRYGQRFSLNKQTEIPALLSTNMCRHSTLFVLRLLEAAGVQGWRVAGGFIRSKEGLMEPHYWLDSGGCILDLTADQFGWEPVVLSAAPDERYQAVEDMSKKSRVATLVATVRQWEGESASFWQETDPRFVRMKAEYPVLLDVIVRLCSHAHELDAPSSAECCDQVPRNTGARP